MKSDLEKSIEAIKNIIPVEIRHVDLERLVAVGIGRGTLVYLVKKEGWSEFSAYDESGRMFILSLFTNPLVAKESWINLSSKTEELQKIKIATNFIVGLSSEIGLKPPKNFLWKLKNLFGTYELDYNNISYQILPESLGGFDEIELWSSCKVIPIYKGNKPYELIINELKEILKKE